jgi:hypothetical protein
MNGHFPIAREPREGAEKPQCGASVTAVRPGRAVNGYFVRPNAEITYVQNPIESNSEGRLKSENILVQSFDCAVNIAGRAKKHRPCLATSGRKP